MFKIGTVLYLELEHRGKVENCRCRIVEINEHQLSIDYPINMETNRTVFLIDGTQLKVSFVSQDNNSVYLFDSEVLGRMKENIPMLLLSYPGDDKLVKIQRRQYVRVEATVDVAVHPITDEFTPFTCITDDISAGGTSVIVRNTTILQQGQNLFLWLVLPLQSGETRYMKLQASVVRTIELDELRSKVSLQFDDLTPQDIQLLLRFSFDRQLMLKKKGIV